MTAIRKLLPFEYPLYAAHLIRLSPDERACRFMGPVRDEMMEAHVHDIQRPGNLVLGAFVDGWLRGAAELVVTSPAVPALGQGEAELAITVEGAFQGRGIGTELVRRTLLAARNRGIETVHTVSLVENLRLRRIVDHAGGKVHCHHGMCEGDIELTLPTQVSLIEEAMDEGAAVVTDLLDRIGWSGPRDEVIAAAEEAAPVDVPANPDRPDKPDNVVPFKAGKDRLKAT